MTVCDYIDVHFAEDLLLDEIASMSGFSKYHFERLFKEFTNMSFYKYVNRKRISHAEQLLGDNSLSITDVAIQSGFSNQSSFIRMFKIMNGCTPTDFRRMKDPDTHEKRRKMIFLIKEFRGIHLVIIINTKIDKLAEEFDKMKGE